MNTERDALRAMDEFGAAVVAALNAAGVRPSPLADVCAVMVVVGVESDPAPVGASLNYIAREGRWEASRELQQGRREPREGERACASCGAAFRGAGRLCPECDARAAPQGGSA